MRIPALKKIVVNMGLGIAKDEPQQLERGIEELTTITGQKPVVTRAKKSIANFNIREGMPIGVRVTLRGAKMYEFLDRFISLALPRVRDFNGVSDRSFDGSGNYSIGVQEQIIFPEIEYDKVDRIRGMDVTFVTSSETDEECFELLRLFGMPFVRREESQQAA
jgi:large subunit ribosomal protein L5